jgi:D-amino peptidase
VKVYISVDMEGVSGLTDADDMHPGGRGYDRGCELMTADANAAINAAFEAGADEVLVNDSHSSGKNLRADLIDDRCALLRGPGRPMAMGEGLDASFDAALYVGYHARAGRPGVLNHTWMGHEIHDLYLNGAVTGEIGLMAAYAGSLGVPVALVTGDESACAEARETLGEVMTVPVKRGVNRFAGEVVPPRRAAELIRCGALQALEELGDRAPYTVAAPYTLRVEWNSTAIAQACAMVPAVRRVDGRTTEFTSDDFTDVVGLLGVMSNLGGTIGCDSGRYG